MNTTFSENDRWFLKSVGIRAEPTHDDTRLGDINNAPSAGWCEEPDYTTPQGFPICEECGRSTRNLNQLICKPCRNQTRLILTDADRRWLREIGIAR